ncbi:MAG TPA: hypothetical protein VHQ00_07400, partial [Chloroflexota bacterium]|nr:hypothetical protein [Chloroflexota bacterium]
MAVTKAVMENPGAETVLSLSHRGRGPTAPGVVRVRISTWSVVAGGMLILWSLTYLARQQLPAAVTVA